MNLNKEIVEGMYIALIFIAGYGTGERHGGELGQL